MFIRAYLRASTSEQDASRAKSALDVFATEHGLRIAARYVENESGEPPRVCRRPWVVSHAAISMLSAAA